MEILAFGVTADEKPLLEQAFAGAHEVRCLDVFLGADTAPIATGGRPAPRGAASRASAWTCTRRRPARLVTFPNVVVTSHQAYYTTDAVGQIIDTTVANVADYLAGRRSENTLVGSVSPSGD